MGCTNSNEIEIIRPINKKISKKDINQETYKEINFSNKNLLENENGLINLGNTCYINSILQILLKIDPLMFYFKNNLHIKESNLITKNQETICMFISDIAECFSENNNKVIEVNDFYKFLLKNYNVVIEHEQADAHEFLLFILDSIHQELNRSEKNNNLKIQEKLVTENLELKSKESWKNYLKLNRSIIIDLFQGQNKDLLICEECKIEKHHFEAIMYYSLPVSQNSKNILDCFREFNEFERLDGDDKYFCDNCNKKTNSKKKTEFWKFPPILIIHLKRFKFENMEFKKINSLIDFPIKDLDLTEFSKGFQREKPIYDLLGIINHQGEMNEGHYFSFNYNINSEQWYFFDDDNFGKINEYDIANDLISEDAYLLFYYKKSITKIKKQTLSFPNNWPFENKKKFKKTIIDSKQTLIKDYKKKSLSYN